MNQFIEHDYPHLIQKINAAGLDPSLWQPCLKAISQTFGDALIQLHVSQPHADQAPFLVDWGTDETAITSYIEHFTKVNPYPALALAKQPVGLPVCATELVSFEKGQHSEIFNDWMKPNGWGLEHIGVTLSKDPDHIAVLALSPQTSRPYEHMRDSLKNLSLLIAPIQGALQFNRALIEKENRVNTLEAMIERMDAAAFVLDRERKLIFNNQKAQRLMGLKHVLRINRSGKLYCPNSDANAVLQAALTTPQANGNVSIKKTINLTPQREIKKQIVAWVTSCEHFDQTETHSHPYLLKQLAPSAAWIVMVKQLGTGIDVSPEIIQSALKLTPAEAKVASAVAADISLNDYAKKREIKLVTPQSQLKSVFRKLGINSQKELVTLIAHLRNADLWE